ncbi:hypothetical protein MKW98_010013 [Papaver atlanticum]|uniref:Glycosyltransferase N-terminal domain-containing protein n=1 Tax=Papaver atlanticum TaxID=357466 RepID=A0AAD4RY65_9MAGN|nr:hypothetical protein MKW98_010013 [Papaver atlanticum]
MASEISHQHQLHVFIFPVTAQGHMIPMINIAKLFAARGVKTTIISTPLNAITLSKTIDQDRLSGLDINIQTIPFPAVEVGLPAGTESVTQLTSPDMMPKFFLAVGMLQQPFEKLLEEYRPDFVVADMFLAWTTEAAAKFGIPRLIFHGTNIFSQCVAESLRINKPFESIIDDKETFLVPGLPNKIEMTLSQVPEHIQKETDSLFCVVAEKIRVSEQKSYGVLVNSFYELESAYADYYKNAMGIRAWQIGPVSLRNSDTLDKAERGKKSPIEEHNVLKWLDSKKPNSVIYVSFGKQFYNEKFVTQVLKIGSTVGAEEWKEWVETTKVSVIKKEKISKAVTQLMSDDGEENKEMRKRVIELSEKAKRAVKEDGSSNVQLTALIEELKMSKK